MAYEGMIRVSKLLFQVIIVMAFLGQPLLALSTSCTYMAVHTVSGSHLMDTNHKGHIQQVHQAKHREDSASECCDTSTCNMNDCLSSSQVAHTFPFSPLLITVKIPDVFRPVFRESYSDFESNSFFRPPISHITG